MDGRGGLKLEKIGPTFSSFIPAKIAKKLLWLMLPDEICLIFYSYL